MGMKETVVYPGASFDCHQQPLLLDATVTQILDFAVSPPGFEPVNWSMEILERQIHLPVYIRCQLLALLKTFYRVLSFPDRIA